MPWTWVRPADAALLSPRPLLDVGVGDAQTLAALGGGAGLVVGLDRSATALRAARRMLAGRLVQGEAAALPFRPAAFAVVLAADLFHHLDAEALGRVLEEVRRVLRPGGHLVAWWYAAPGRPGPGSPPHPRPFEEVAAAAWQVGFRTCHRLGLTAIGPATAGMVARA